jgi:hypothetical protein
MKAKHKYNPRNKEGARRIAQSYGYRHTIQDEPRLIALLYRAGIEMQGHDYGGDTSTSFKQDVLPTDYIADTETIKL